MKHLKKDRKCVYPICEKLYANSHDLKVNMSKHHSVKDIEAKILNPN